MEKKKRGKTLNLKINFTNRWLYTSITFLVVAVLAAFVYAQNPDVFGHHYDDLDLGPLDIESDLVIIDGGTGKALRIVGSNHVFQEFYSQGLSNSRSGYIGYGDSGTNHLTIANQKSGGDTIFRINSSEGSWLESMRITSSGIDVSGNVEADSLNVNGDTALNGLLNVSGNATANYFIGDGSQLTGIDSGSSLWTQDGDGEGYYIGTPSIGAYNGYYFSKKGALGNGYVRCDSSSNVVDLDTNSGAYYVCKNPSVVYMAGLEGGEIYGDSQNPGPRIKLSSADHNHDAACVALGFEPKRNPGYEEASSNNVYTATWVSFSSDSKRRIWETKAWNEQDDYFTSIECYLDIQA